VVTQDKIELKIQQSERKLGHSRCIKDGEISPYVI